VLDLTENLKNSNHIVVMDNYFSSPALFDLLKKKGIYAMGTVRPNREGLPRKLLDMKKSKRGQYEHRLSDTGLFYLQWKDSKVVNFLSNYHGNDVVNVNRTIKNGSKVQVPALSVVADYNKYMGGVDKSDMLRSLYEFDRKTRRFWIRLVSAKRRIIL
jgi:hypothetical protein